MQAFCNTRGDFHMESTALVPFYQKKTLQYYMYNTAIYLIGA